MTHTLRPFDDEYAEILPLLNLINDKPMTEAQLRAAHEDFPEGGLRRRMVAVDDAGRVVGYANAAHWPQWPVGRYYMTLVVAPDARRQGVGKALLNDLSGWVESNGGERLITSVDDADEESLRFGLNHSFPIQRHPIDSRLDVVAFDEAPFAGAVERSLGDMRVLTYAAHPDEAMRRQLYELYKITDLDSPGYIGTDPADYPPFEAWQEDIFGDDLDKVLPEAVLVVADGDRWVGTTILQYAGEDKSLYNEYTGVLREYRGRGIAMALKLLNTRAARAYGAPQITTRNDESNAPMRAINNKLGYVKVSGRYWLAKDF